jgi:hypothetical protein
MDQLLAPISGAERRDIGGAQVDVMRAGAARIRRIVYPAGFRWSHSVKPTVHTDSCMHAHVGFLARGRIQGEYRDGCRFDFIAPQALVVEPDHDAWVVGDEPAVLIEIDFERETTARLGLPDTHRHG